MSEPYPCGLDRLPRTPSSMRRGLRWALALSGAAVLTAYMTEVAFAQTVSSDITDEFRLAAVDWTGRLKPLAQKTFALLAGVEFAVSAIVWGFQREAFDDAIGQFFIKCALLSFLFMCLLFFDTWIPAIVNSFVVAGQTAVGTSSLNPTEVVELGLELNGKMMKQVFGLGLLISPAQQFAVAWSSIVLLIAFAVIAAQLVILLIESYIAVTAGVFFLGFAAFRGTVSFTDRYLVWAVSVGVRLFLIYLIIGIGMGVAESWTGYLDTVGALDYFAAFRIVIGAVIFALVAVIIPNRTARYLVEGASFGLHDAFRSS